MARHVLTLIALALFSLSAYATDYHLDEGEAYAHCHAAGRQNVAQDPADPITGWHCERRTDTTAALNNYWWYKLHLCNNPSAQGNTPSCTGYQPTVEADHRFPPSTPCSLRNRDLGLNPPRPSLVLERCVAGCRFKMVQDGTVTTTIQSLSDGTTATIYRGVMEYDGTLCIGTGTDPNRRDAEPPPKQVCSPVSGQTLCIRDDGQHCFTASTGRMICWRPDETGEKSDGPVRQVRAPGATPPSAPSTPPPPDAQWTPGPGSPSVVNRSGNSITNITNITNFTTTTGAPAGPRNDGEPNDGQSGGQSGGSGSQASGGDTCDAPPACSGDVVGCAILRQQWETRCNLERAPDHDAFDLIESDPAYPLHRELEVEPVDTGVLSSAQGWSGRGACPVRLELTTQLGAFSLDPTHMCNFLDALAALVLVAGTISAGFILAGGVKVT